MNPAASLEAALGERPGAREHWDGFTASTRRTLLAWIATAKREDTRRRRVIETADLAQQGKPAS